MQIEERCYQGERFLCVTITDKVMTVAVEKTLLKSIQNACEESNIAKVFLSILSIEKRVGENHQFLSVFTEHLNVKIATLCTPSLIDDQAKLFRAYTYNGRYVLNYFTEEEAALGWLMSS